MKSSKMKNNSLLSIYFLLFVFIVLLNIIVLIQFDSSVFFKL